MQEYTNSPAPDNHTPRYDWPATPAESWPNTPRITWADYLDLWAAEIGSDRSPAAQFLAARLHEYAADAHQCGLATPEDHARWEEECEAEAHAWLMGGWDEHGGGGHDADERVYAPDTDPDLN